MLKATDIKNEIHTETRGFDTTCRKKEQGKRQMVNENMQFCSDCGNVYSRRAAACPKCGCPSGFAVRIAVQPGIAVQPSNQKDRLTYILLGLFLGGLGIHNFYSGHAERGVAKIILTILIIPAVFSGIWSLIEICTVKADVNGVPFK